MSEYSSRGERISNRVGRRYVTDWEEARNG